MKKNDFSLSELKTNIKASGSVTDLVKQKNK